MTFTIPSDARLRQVLVFTLLMFIWIYVGDRESLAKGIKGAVPFWQVDIGFHISKECLPVS